MHIIVFIVILSVAIVYLARPPPHFLLKSREVVYNSF